MLTPEGSSWQTAMWAFKRFFKLRTQCEWEERWNVVWATAGLESESKGGRDANEEEIGGWEWVKPKPGDPKGYGWC